MHMQHRTCKWYVQKTRVDDVVIHVIYLMKCIISAANICRKNVLKFGDDRIRIGEVINFLVSVIWKVAYYMI